MSYQFNNTLKIKNMISEKLNKLIKDIKNTAKGNDNNCIEFLLYWHNTGILFSTFMKLGGTLKQFEKSVKLINNINTKKNHHGKI